MRCLFLSIVFFASRCILSGANQAQSLPRKVAIHIHGVTGETPVGWKEAKAEPNSMCFVSTVNSATICIRSVKEAKKITESTFARYARSQFQKAREMSVGPVKGVQIQLPDFLFYGGPRSDGRVFAGWMHADRNLLVIIEGDVGEKDPKLAMKMVSDFMQGLKFGE